MNRLFDPGFRGLLGLSRGAVMWLPLVVMLLWGGSYIRSCLLVLQSPGTGFIVEYLGQGGAVTAKTSGYAFSLSPLGLVMTDLAVADETGETHAFARRATVGRALSGTIRIRANEVDAKVVRRQDGGLDIFDLLPPRREPSTTRYVVEIDQAVIQYVDLSRLAPLRRTVSVRNVLASSSEGDTKARGDVQFPGAGVAELGVTLLNGGRTQVVFSTASLDIADLWETASPWLPTSVRESLVGYEAESLVLAGEGQVDIAPGAAPRFFVDADFAAENAVVGEYGRWTRASGHVSTDGKLTLLDVVAEAPGRFVDVAGAVDLNDAVRASGEGRARVASLQSLPLQVRRMLPADTSFQNADFLGSASYVRGQWTVNGDISATRLYAQGETLQNVRARIDGSQTAVLATDVSARVRNVPVSGWVGFESRSKRLTGLVNAESGALTPLLVDSAAEGLALRGPVSAIIGGTLTAPTAEIGYRGLADFRGPDGVVRQLGEVDLVAGYADGTLTIERGVLSGAYGVASASGDFTIGQGGNALDVQVIGLNLGQFDPNLTGVVFAEGVLAGSTQGYRFDARTEIYNLGYQDIEIPVATANVAYDGTMVTVDSIEAQSGLGKVEGAVAMRLEDRSISGVLSAQNLFISDYSDADVIGRVDVESVTIAGTLDEPQARVVARASDLLVYGQPIESADAVVNASRAGATIELLDVDLLDGRLVADGGRYDFETGAVSLEGRLEAVSFDRLNIRTDMVDLDGLMSGPFTFRQSPDGQRAGTFNGQLTDVTVNNFEFGGGEARLRLVDQLVSGSVQVASVSGLEVSLLEITEASYDFDSGLYGGNIVATALDIDKVWQALRNDAQLSNDRLRGLLDSATGKVNMLANVEGTPDGLVASVESLTVDSLNALGRDLGRIEAVGSTDLDAWSLERFSWVMDDGRLLVRGNGRNDGYIEDLDGELTNFDPAVLSLLVEGLPNVHADLNVTFANLNGTPSRLNGAASLTLTNVSMQDAAGNETPIPLAITTDGITLTDGRFDVLAEITYRGFSGRLTGDVPLTAFQSEPVGQARLELDLTPVSLDELAADLPQIDEDRSSGTVEGEFVVVMDSQSRDVSGSVRVVPEEGQEAASVGIDGVSTALLGLTANLGVSNDSITVEASGTGSNGGTLQANVRADVASLMSGAIDDESVRAIPLSGQLVLDGFKAIETIRLTENTGTSAVTYVASSPSQALLDGTVTVGGTALSPAIGGQVTADDLVVHLPTQFPEVRQGEGSEFGPVFDNLQITALTGSDINLFIGDLIVQGTLTLDGPLSALNINAPFYVEGGVFQLPTTRVNLQEGGTINVNSSSVTQETFVNVNIQGDTVVTVRETSERYETYRINLNIQGNILQPDGVIVTGVSDPPTLSQEEIQAIIGQRDLIESIAAGAFGGAGTNRLTESLFTVALPILTQGLTANIAKSLQLDYLVLDYNPFDQAIVRGGKTLIPGLQLEFSRQLFDPQNGPARGEFKLSYRIPSSNPLLSRTRISLGFTESVPWRVGLDYSIRF